MKPRLERIRRSLPSLGLATLAGLVLAFAGAPFGYSTLAFGSAPLFQRALELVPRETGPIRGAIVVGLATGVAFHVVASYWMVPLFTVNVHALPAIALFLSFLFFVVQSLPLVVAAAIARGFGLLGVPLAFVVPAAITVAFTRSYMLFPWRPSRFAIECLPWVQLAEVGGEPLLDLLLCTAGCALLEAWRLRSRWAAAIAFAALLGPIAYGVPRIRAIEDAAARAPVTRVGIVQPNIPQSIKFDVTLARRHLYVLQRLTRRVEAGHPDFTIWPETSYPFYFDRHATADAPGMKGLRWSRDVRGPVLFGAITDGGSRCDHRNSVVAMDAEGHVVGFADKVNPLPFTERIPLWQWSSIVRSVIPCPGYVVGSGGQVITLAGRRLGILNCYEDILPEYVREVALRDVDFLVNVTNDAWFLDTTEPHLHHMAARMRAIETRREVVRAVNTGVSGILHATGARGHETRTFVETAFVVPVRSLRITTPWVRYGDVVTPLLESALLALAVALLAARRLRAH